MENQQMQQPATLFERYKTLIKGLFIGFLSLIMLIPTVYILNLVRERQIRQYQVIKEVSSKWAEEQVIKGPVICVPAYTVTKDKDGKQEVTTRNVYLLPEQLKINGQMQPEVRHRSIYKVIVYRSRLQLEGSFDAGVLARYSTDSLDWSKARLLVGINDTKGLEDNPVLKWGDSVTGMESAAAPAAFLTEELNSAVKFGPAQKVNFHISLNLKGTGKLYFTPVGKTNLVQLNAPWKTPAFDGKYLPDEIPRLDDSGFSAKWKIIQASRGYPQYWKEDEHPDLDRSTFGVTLLQQADHYSKTERSVKYAILIISLTFLVFLFLEIIQKRNVHPLQYLLVGMALVIFYTLLLSISEYTGFNIAYLVAAVATVSLITWYIQTIFRKLKIALGFLFSLSALYAYIFFLIQLKDHALLFGSIGLFVILAIIMYYSRNIDWYGGGKQANNEKQ